jgi:hypothetical protein
MKRAPKLRDGEQIQTRPVSLVEIMSDPKFGQGAKDVRRGRGYPADYDVWKNTNGRWAYDRGRQWATVAPRHVVLKANGKIRQHGDGTHVRKFCEVMRRLQQ